MKRVFISCPPMLAEKQQIADLSAEYEIELVPGDVVQTLTEQELKDILPHYDGWIAGDDPGSHAVLQTGFDGRLRALVKWGIGVDNIDAQAVSALGLKFANTPGMFSNEVADLAVGYLIALSRDILAVDKAVRSGNWIKPQGISLSGKKAGIVGLGNIGQALARRLQAMDMKLRGYDPYVKSLDGVSIDDWPTELGSLDFLFLCCALTDENYHLISSEVLGQLPDHAFVINVSRGPLIDEHALILALQDQRLAGAALDVFEQEPLDPSSALMALPKVILGSHNASNTTEAVRATNVKAVRLMAEFLRSTG